MTIGQGGSKAPLSPISPRSAKRVSGLGALGQEVASSDSSFSVKVCRRMCVIESGFFGLLEYLSLGLVKPSRSCWFSASYPAFRDMA